MRPQYWLPLTLLLMILAGGWWIGPFSNPVTVEEIAGQVTDSDGPLCRARVRFRGERQASLTDCQGHFHLPSPAGKKTKLFVSKQGYFVQGFPAKGLPGPFQLSRLPGMDNLNYSWTEPGPEPAGVNNCVNCHKEIYQEWQGSAHAGSASNRRFLNLYDGSDWHGREAVGWNLQADNFDGAGVCAACHLPTLTSDQPAFDDFRKVAGVDKRGVHCDFCHKVADATADPRGLTFGRFGYKLLRPQKGQIVFGALDDVARPGESFSFAPVYRDSRYCASCHEGVVFGVPVYTTYSEWRASPAAREGFHCQSCHMAPTGRLTNIAPGKGGIERDPRTLASHRFPGGQADLLRACLTVSARLFQEPGAVRVQVRVKADRVGHRVPTGFIDRNLILLVEALDRAGKSVPLKSGPALPGLAGRDLAGQPGRLYAKQWAEKDARNPLPFWQAGGKLVDTRLYPRRPDGAEFHFPRQVDRIRVRLLYRRFWQEVADTKSWPDNEIVVVDRTWNR
jgi:hypothetical protein